jgi:hypothetical protein
MSTIAQENSLFEIDQELDLLLDEIQEQTATEGEEEIPAELMIRFRQFCDAHYEKVDRIGRFLTLMEWRTQYCRAEATRLYERARTADNKAGRTRSMVLYYLGSRDLRKIEGRECSLSDRRRTVRTRCSSLMRRWSPWNSVMWRPRFQDGLAIHPCKPASGGRKVTEWLCPADEAQQRSDQAGH